MCSMCFVMCILLRKSSYIINPSLMQRNCPINLNLNYWFIIDLFISKQLIELVTDLSSSFPSSYIFIYIEVSEKIYQKLNLLKIWSTKYSSCFMLVKFIENSINLLIFTFISDLFFLPFVLYIYVNYLIFIMWYFKIQNLKQSTIESKINNLLRN